MPSEHQIVGVDGFAGNEVGDAKTYWSSIDVSNHGTYLKRQAWSIELAELFAARAPRSVFEFGCNAGKNLLTVRERLPKCFLAGIDINAQAIEVARKSKLRTSVGDEKLLELFPNRAFDICFTVSVLDHMPEPAPALRMGHAVLHVSDHGAAVAWLRERLGLIPSDHFGPPTGDVRDAKGTFLRVDRGSALVDHHCLLVLEADHLGCHHISFEMQDLDHVMAAHDHLVARGWRLDCGVGRHLLGSQIYDYWRDPAGFRVEHYTDGDVVNHEHRPTVFSGTADETTQWGMAPSKEFFS